MRTDVAVICMPVTGWDIRRRSKPGHQGAVCDRRELGPLLLAMRRH